MPLQLDGVSFDGPVNRHALLAVAALVGFVVNVPLVYPLGYPGVVEHAVQLVAVLPSVA